MQKSFKTILNFLSDYPHLLSLRGNTKDFDAMDQEQIEKIQSQFLNSRNKTLVLPQPTTIQDPAVGAILQISEGYNSDYVNKILLEHQLAMLAENNVGLALEMYIASELEKDGWIWCSGDVVHAIDFIKKTKDGWLALQIKNRNTTENSSSSKIRDNKGITIDKWFRMHSKAAKTRGIYNWEKFPIDTASNTLSEAGFLNFIKNNSI